MMKRMIRDGVRYEILCLDNGWCEVVVDDVAYAKVTNYEEARRVVWLILKESDSEVEYITDDMFEEFD